MKTFEQFETQSSVNESSLKSENSLVKALKGAKNPAQAIAYLAHHYSEKDTSDGVAMALWDLVDKFNDQR